MLGLGRIGYGGFETYPLMKQTVGLEEVGNNRRNSLEPGRCADRADQLHNLLRDQSIGKYGWPCTNAGSCRDAPPMSMAAARRLGLSQRHRSLLGSLRLARHTSSLDSPVEMAQHVIMYAVPPAYWFSSSQTAGRAPVRWCDTVWFGCGPPPHSHLAYLSD